jgi:hypothetical protein
MSHFDVDDDDFDVSHYVIYDIRYYMPVIHNYSTFVMLATQQPEGKCV